jgi:hypothetical protein
MFKVLENGVVGNIVNQRGRRDLNPRELELQPAKIKAIRRCVCQFRHVRASTAYCGKL